VPVIVSIVVMCVIALLFIPIFGLTGFHIVLGKGNGTRDSTAVTGSLNNYTFADFFCTTSDFPDFMLWQIY
jgi:hypothetical protein